MSRLWFAGCLLGTVVVTACASAPEGQSVGASAQGISRAPKADPGLDACASALGPSLKELDARLSAHARAPSAETREAVEALLTVGPLTSSESGVASFAPPQEIVSSAEARAMTDAQLARSLGEATLLATCKTLRATEALITGTLAERTEAASVLALEDAARRAARTSDVEGSSTPGEDAGTGADAGSDAGAPTAEAGTDAAATADGGSSGQGGLYCRPFRFTDEDLRRLRDAPTGSSWYADGGGDLGLYWGVLGRQRPSGTAFGLFAAYREIDGGCFIGIGGSFTF